MEENGGREDGGRRGEGRGGRREGRGGLSGNVAEEAFCLKSALVKVSDDDRRSGLSVCQLSVI